MKQITILGATGLVGKKLLQKAVENRIKVKVLVRNKEKLQDFAHVVEVIEGNYFDSNKLQKALEGSEVILSTIGPPINGKLSNDDEENYINSLAYIIKQMQENKQTRFISISGAGVKIPNENLPLTRKLLRVMIKSKSKSIISTKDRELQMLGQSNLDWTNIRPPMIKEKVDGRFVADETKFMGMSVDLNQLSEFMLAEINNNEWIKKAPVVGTK
ncbi:NAD(P)H-binding protein [Maribacter sp. ANRC-HE7]|uniref:NAD(P)H-binding protein n=1 Tax=Maribacter aquimaris TaxID=2737171 RepID=A0ABR7UYW6_9FLAO|nr:NAD(P)H-binding protein [Maribacter aquimaris]MBD0777476.1 NAD(P)H-binding protein [Maribacter aquimaris]